VNRSEKLVAIIAAVAKKPVSPDPTESLFDSGLLDSFALTDLVAGIEKEFGLSIPDADLNPRKFDSIERILEYLDSRS
jgi:acyl carrier protein